MKTGNLIRLVIVLLIIGANCQGNSMKKSDYIKKYDLWITHLQGEYKTYTKPDWVAAEKVFVNFSETEYKKFETEFTEKEKIMLDSLAGCYYGMKLIYKARQAKQEAKSAVNVAKGILEEINKEIKKELEE